MSTIRPKSEENYGVTVPAQLGHPMFDALLVSDLSYTDILSCLGYDDDIVNLARELEDA